MVEKLKYLLTLILKKHLKERYFISPSAEFTPKNIQTKEDRAKLVYAIKVTIKNINNILKSGMPADAKIYVEIK